MTTPRRRTTAKAAPAPAVPAPDVPKACPDCRSPKVTHLAMTLTDGTPVTMISCSNCDTRSWWEGAERLPLQKVVDLATKPGATGLDLRERKRTDPVPPPGASRRTK